MHIDLIFLRILGLIVRPYDRPFFQNPLFLGLLGLIVVCCRLGQATETSSFKQRADRKTAQRWTLQEWMEQKEKNRWMDQWLLLHTPSPYEFALEILSLDYALKSSENPLQKHQSLTGSFTAYATLVGLELQTSNNASEGFIDNTGLFLLRLLGSSDQGSHITLGLGQKKRQYSDPALPLRTQILGQVDLTLYLNHHFGFKFLHREFSPIEDHPVFGTLKGHEQFLSLFLDFANLRIFGGLTLEKETQSFPQQTYQQVIEGTHWGLRLYF